MPRHRRREDRPERCLTRFSHRSPRDVAPRSLISEHLCTVRNHRELCAMSDDSPPFWFAIWNVRANFAYALDAYPEELKPYERSLRSARRAWGDNFTGPFTFFKSDTSHVTHADFRLEVRQSRSIAARASSTRCSAPSSLQRLSPARASSPTARGATPSSARSAAAASTSTPPMASTIPDATAREPAIWSVASRRGSSSR